MATSGNTNVQLTVEATTLGGDAVRALADQVRALGKSGGDAAPEFNALAEQLDRVAAQASAVETFGALEANVKATVTAVDQATIAFNASKAALEEQAAATATLKASQSQAASALNDARLAAIGAKEAFGILNAEVKSHSEASANDTERLREARIAVAEASAEVARQRLALKELNDEVSTASKGESALATAVRGRSRELGAAQAAAEAQAAALEKAGTAARELAVDTTNLAGAQTELLQKQQEVTQAVLAQQAAVAASQAAKQQAEENALYQEYQAAIEEVDQRLADQAAQERAVAEALAAKGLAQQTEAYAAYLAAVEEINAVLHEEAAALEALNEKKAEQAESDRLAIIQQNALFEVRKQGAEELLAERAAIAEAAAAAAEYDAQVKAAADATLSFAAAAQRAQGAVEEAFSQIGVRSVGAIRAEIEATERALIVLEEGFERGAITSQDMARGIGAAQARLAELRGEAAKLPEAAGVLETMNASVLSLVNRFGALGAAVATVGFAVRPIIEANVQLETMRRVLTSVYGSLEAANQQIAFLQTTADKSGVAVNAISDSFVQFAASAKASGIELSLIQEVFSNTVNAAGNLGLSGEKVTLILEALGQMASKGVVAMQELRQQLGNSLPGALNLMAQGLGITQAQLVKLVESGQLLTSQALPALAQALTQLGSKGQDVEGLQQSFARLQNAVLKTYQSFSNTTAYAVLNAAIASLARNFDLVFTSAKALGELWAVSKVIDYVSGVVRLNESLALTKVATDATITSTAAATTAEAENTAAQTANTLARRENIVATQAQTAANRSSALAWGDLGGSIGGVGPRLETVAPAAGVATRAFGALAGAARGALNLLGGIPGVAAIVLLNAKEIGTAIGETAASWTHWGTVLKDNEKKLADQAAAEAKASAASQQLGSSIVKLIANYTDQAAPIEKIIAASEKRLKGMKDEGDAMVNITKLSANQNAILGTTAQAELNTAAAAQIVADARQRQVDLTSKLVEGLQAHALAAGTLNAAEQKQLTTLQSTLLVEQAAAEEAQAHADKLATVAAGAKLASDSFGDMSNSLDLVRQRFENAQDKVNVLSGLLRDGSISQAQYSAAVRDASAAEGLYVKALSDSQAAVVRKIAALQSDTLVTNANIAAQVQASKANEAFYASVHDGAAAIREKVTQAELEERQIKLTSAAKLTEAKLTQAAAEAELADARARGVLTPAIQAEIDKRIANAKAMAIEAGAGASRIAEIDSEIAALRKQAEVQDRVTTSVQANTIAVQANVKASAEQLANDRLLAAGNTGAVDNTGVSDLQSKIKAGTLTSSDAGELTAAIASLKQNQQANEAALRENPGLVDPSAISSVNGPLAQLTAALQRLNGTDGNAALGTGTSKPPGTGTGTGVTATPSGSTSHTVNITLNGTSTVINAATAADATALASVMAQLSAAAKTAQTGG